MCVITHFACSIANVRWYSRQTNHHETHLILRTIELIPTKHYEQCDWCDLCFLLALYRWTKNSGNWVLPCQWVFRSKWPTLDDLMANAVILAQSFMHTIVLNTCTSTKCWEKMSFPASDTLYASLVVARSVTANGKIGHNPGGRSQDSDRAETVYIFDAYTAGILFLE